MHYKKRINDFYFEIVPSEYGENLRIKRGKVEIEMELPSYISNDTTKIETIIERFMTDMDFRKEVTQQAEPLRGYGYLDIDFIMEYYPENQQITIIEKIQELITAEKNSENEIAPVENYLKLKSGLDEYSELSMEKMEKLVPLEILKEARQYPYKRLVLRFLRWYLRGLPLQTLRNKMKVDRRYKIY